MVTYVKNAIKLLFVCFLISSCAACSTTDEAVRSQPDSEIETSVSTSSKASRQGFQSESESESDQSALESSLETDESSANESILPSSAAEDSPNVVMNPQTSPPLEREEEMENNRRCERRKNLIANATEIENYLRSALSSEDHGGIYVLEGEPITLNIWVVNEDAVRSAIQSYPNVQCEIVLENAKCSLETMTNFAESLQSIPLASGEKIKFLVYEDYNVVAISITNTCEKRVKNEISALMEIHHMPSDGVILTVYDPNQKDNPVT